MRPVYRVTSQKYHNEDSSNLTEYGTQNRCQGITESKRSDYGYVRQYKTL